MKVDLKGAYILRSAVILCVTLLCYLPSLLHVPRSDQIAYFADVANKKDLYSLTIGSFDLNRASQFNRGDEFLFRPLVFFFLGAEKYFFGYHFIWWQAVGILLHILTLGILLKLLLNIRQSRVAFVLVGYFATSSLCIEMVTWQHIHSFLILLAAILIVLDQVYSYIHKGDQKFWRLVVISCCLLTASLVWEIGIVFSSLIFIYFCMHASRDDRQWLGRTFMVFPVWIYLLLNALNWTCHQHSGIAHGSNLSLNGMTNVVMNGFIGQLYWLMFGLFPDQVSFDIFSRTFLFQRDTIGALSVFSVVFVILSGYVLMKGGLPRILLFKKWQFTDLLFWMVFSYVAVLSLGRATLLGWKALTISAYYPHIFWALVLVFVYSCINFVLPIHPLVKWVMCGSLSVIIALNICTVLSTNVVRADAVAESRKLIAAIEEMKKAHAKNGRFSFYISEYFPGNHSLKWLSNSDYPGKRYSFIEALYLDSFDPVNPVVPEREIYAYLNKKQGS